MQENDRKREGNWLNMLLQRGRNRGKKWVDVVFSFCGEKGVSSGLEMDDILSREVLFRISISNIYFPEESLKKELVFVFGICIGDLERDSPFRISLPWIPVSGIQDPYVR